MEERVYKYNEINPSNQVKRLLGMVLNANMLMIFLLEK